MPLRISALPFCTIFENTVKSGKGALPFPIAKAEIGLKNMETKTINSNPPLRTIRIT
jgi:hypothetical protein